MYSQSSEMKLSNQVQLSSKNDTGDTTEDNTDLIVAKVVAMLVLGIVSFMLGILPIKLAAWMKWGKSMNDPEFGDRLRPQNTKSEIILSLMLSFGGGALLSTTFLHMLPEVRENISSLQASGKIAETEFHLTEVIMCCGFFAMYLVEELVHLYLHARKRKKHHFAVENVVHRSLSVRKCSENASRRGVVEDTCTTVSSAVSCTMTPSGLMYEDTNEMKKGYGDGIMYENVTESRLPTANSTNMDYVDVKTKLGDSLPQIEYENEGVMHHSTSALHGHSHMTLPENDAMVTTLRGLLVVLALSVHELFEGLAVGLQDTVGYVYYLLGAVSAHKMVIAFCVGVELVSAGTKLAFTVLYVLTFAVVSPLGIGIGLALSAGDSESLSNGVVNVVLQGLATGTLLYVVFFEVLQRQRTRDHFGLRQLLAVVAGFGVMFGLLVAVGHNHDHGHEEDSHCDDHHH